MAKPSVTLFHVASPFDAISDALDDSDLSLDATYTDGDGEDHDIRVSFQSGTAPSGMATGGPGVTGAYAVATTSILSVTQSRPGTALSVGDLRFKISEIKPLGSRAMLKLQGPL